MTRQQEERDPEAEADFDRELAKLMSESLDSRKFERKPMFDVPLPMRRGQRDASTAGDESPNDGTTTPPTTMAFSLMTKKGNRQQVCPGDFIDAGQCCLLTCGIDSVHRIAFGLPLCHCHEVPKGS